jgi:hypothetical protein
MHFLLYLTMGTDHLNYAKDPIPLLNLYLSIKSLPRQKALKTNCIH